MKRIVLALILVAFLALTLFQLDLPGLYYDEALDVVPTMQLILGQPLKLERGVGLWIGNTALPLMIMDYLGAVNTYLMLPFFAVLGINVISLRLLTIVLSAITLVLTYRLGSRFFGTATGLLATFLLAIHPSFVFWSRMGITVTSVMTVFSLASLLCFVKWRDKSDAKWFALGCFLLGLGLWAKLLFLWWIVALAVVGGILWLWESRNPQFTIGNSQFISRLGLVWKQALAGLIAFCIGCFPLIWYNLVSGATFSTLQKNLVTTDQGVNNLNILHNLRVAWDTFRILLNGSYFWYQGGPFANDLYLPIFLASVVASVVLVAWRAPQYGQALLAVLAIIALLIAQSSVTVSGHWATHLFISYPFPQLVIALCAVLLAQAWPGARKRLGGALLATLLVLPLIAGDLTVDWQYHSLMSDTKGYASASNTIYKLADYLDKQGIRQPIAMDWGFSKNIQILTQGRVNPEEIYGFGPEGRNIFAGEIRKYLANGDNLYLFHTGPNTVYPRLDIFEQEAGRMDLKLNVEEVFYQQDGVPLYLLVSAR